METLSINNVKLVLQLSSVSFILFCKTILCMFESNVNVSFKFSLSCNTQFINLNQLRHCILLINMTYIHLWSKIFIVLGIIWALIRITNFFFHFYNFIWWFVVQFNPYIHFTFLKSIHSTELGNSAEIISWVVIEWKELKLACLVSCISGALYKQSCSCT
jgi:hypothetical protein